MEEQVKEKTITIEDVLEQQISKNKELCDALETEQRMRREAEVLNRNLLKLLSNPWISFNSYFD